MSVSASVEKRIYLSPRSRDDSGLALRGGRPEPTDTMRPSAHKWMTVEAITLGRCPFLSATSAAAVIDVRRPHMILAAAGGTGCRKASGAHPSAVHHWSGSHECW